MKLTSELSLEQFREEMQHRVVRYPLRSRPVKEAVRFAKGHEDPAFYRIASDKIHAQRQFQRELHGPSRLERLVDFFTLGSLKEVVVTLLLVAAGVVGLDVAQRVMSDPDQEMMAKMDVDALAARLGLALETSRFSEVEAAPHGKDDKPHVNPRFEPSSKTGQLSDADVARIAEAVIERLRAQSEVEAATTEDLTDGKTATDESDSPSVSGSPPSLAAVADPVRPSSEQVQ